jgi:hypothetical protein
MFSDTEISIEASTMGLIMFTISIKKITDTINIQSSFIELFFILNTCVNKKMVLIKAIEPSTIVPFVKATRFVKVLCKILISDILI